MFFTKTFLALVSLAPALVTAQLGVTHVMSNDGTVEYPCEAAAMAEVYYQDKCPRETVDGQALHKVEVSVDYVSSRDDYKLSVKCFYNDDDASFCSYIADKLTPDLTLFDYSPILEAKCKKLFGVAWHKDGAQQPQPSAVPPTSDGFVIPKYVCPTHLDLVSSVLTKFFGNLDSLKPYVCKFNGFECITFEDGAPDFSNNPLCPAQLCPNHFTVDLTRRRLEHPAISRRQVDTAALRRSVTAALRRSVVAARAARAHPTGEPRRLNRLV